MFWQSEKEVILLYIFLEQPVKLSPEAWLLKDGFPGGVKH